MVFIGFVPGGASNDERIYVLDGSQLTLIATESTTIPGTARTLDSFAQVDVDSGSVAFRAVSQTNGDGAVLRHTSAGGLELVADQSTSLPQSKESFAQFDSVSVSQGVVAFVGIYLQSSVIRWGIFAWDRGSLRLLVDDQSVVSSSGERFLDFSELVLEGGVLAFRATTTATSRGIYLLPISNPASVERVLAVGDLIGGEPVANHIFDFDGSSLALWVATVSSSGLLRGAVYRSPVSVSGGGASAIPALGHAASGVLVLLLALGGIALVRKMTI